MRVDLKDCGSVTKITCQQVNNRINMLYMEVPKQEDDGFRAKIFTYLMAKIYKRYHSEDLKITVRVALQEIVNIGCCQSIEEARLKFEETLKILQTWKIKFVGQSEILYPFAGYYDYGNEYAVYLNVYLPLWGELLGGVPCCLPRYYFALPKNAANLLGYIAEQAVNNTKAIKKKGYFIVGLKDIQYALALPDITSKAMYRNVIKDIKLAVKDIEQAEYSAHGALAEILLTVENTGNIERDSLKIELRGRLRNHIEASGEDGGDT